MFSFFVAAYLLQATYMDLFNEGHRLHDQGNVKEAEAAWEKSASLNPAYIPTLKGLAELHAGNRRIKEAIELYLRIIELNPKDINARGRLAELYSWEGKHDKSIVTYRDALELDPGNTGLKTGLATVLRWSHRHDEAERLYKEVLAGDQENHDALKGLAKTYSMMGDLASALSTLDRALGRYPDDAELHKEKGTILAWQKDFKKAVASLDRAIELSPNYVEAYRTLGDVYSWMKAYQAALDAYRKAIDIEPDNIENHLLAAAMHLQTGNRQMAEEGVKAALMIDPSDARALHLLGEMRGEGNYRIIRTLGQSLELISFVIVLIAIFLVSRSKRRMLRRRHRSYYYFINFTLPALVAATFISYLGRDYFSRWVDVSLIEDLTEAVLFLALGASFFVMLWTEHRSREFPKTAVLAVGAHPDDIELGCGGLIMKAKDSGAAVYGLTLTRGERGTDAAGVREDELRKAAGFMELDGFWVMDFPDTGLDKRVPEIKDAIEARIRETGATMVLTHSAMDVHSDHQAVFEATKVAARNVSVICYEDVSTPREFVPDYFVDVTGYIEDKMRLIAFHKTQEDKDYMNPEVVKGRAAHRGIQGGVQYAEAFRIHKLLR